MLRTSNKSASYHVENKEQFKGSHTFAMWNPEHTVYKVYSYGFHFPIYAYKDNTWYRNSDKYSVSTSKHQSQLCPSAICIDIDTEAIQSL